MRRKVEKERSLVSDSGGVKAKMDFAIVVRAYSDYAEKCVQIHKIVT